MFEDRYLTCRDCGEEFVFSAAEQEFFQEKGFVNQPSRCLKCRANRRQRQNQQASENRTMYTVICAQCGQETEVPFNPRGDRPVYCRDCFKALG